MRRQGGHKEHSGGHVFRLEHLLALLVGDRLRPNVQDWSIHLAGVDSADANAAVPFLSGQADPQGMDSMLGRGVTGSPQRSRT